MKEEDVLLSWKEDLINWFKKLVLVQPGMLITMESLH